MCGISGIWSSSAEAVSSHRDQLDRMISAIARRGPDSNGSFLSGNIALGHTRLSIIDLSDAANQPMHDASGRYTLVFNGEIYNHLALRDELSSKHQITFRTKSDTEVLLQGLIVRGLNFIHSCNGFFAFCFYDHDKGKLLLARDRFGIKPLYYHFGGGQLCFASNLKAIQAALPEARLDMRSLANYLQYSYIMAPYSIIDGVQKLLPGHYLQFENAALREGSYYEAYDYKASNQTGDHRPEQDLRVKLAAAVELRLAADVPLGTFLSGGFDSSVITLLASKLRPEISAYTLGFPDTPFYDESTTAAATAKHFGLKHRIFPLTDSDVESALSGFLEAIDEPFADSSAILVYLLSEFASSEVKVALSGDGADEILGGYHKHRALLRSMKWSSGNQILKSAAPFIAALPEARDQKHLNSFRKLKRYAQGLKYQLPERYERWASWTQPEEVAQLLLDPVQPYPLDLEVDGSDFNSILRADVHLVLPNDMLYKVDSMSMHHGLEVRVPFLDHHLVEWVANQPAELKINLNQGKLLLRNAFADDFPSKFFSGAKKGFEAPLRHWFAGALTDWRARLLDWQLLVEQGIFDPEAVKALEQKALKPNAGGAPQTLWAVLIFQHWYYNHFAGS